MPYVCVYVCMYIYIYKADSRVNNNSTSQKGNAYLMLE